ncbi:trimethylguanosine synthase [Thraustotheca clavata]|uniref:Trimethylguanosine synthase n=1 Tax=Thraustotheca clavata TaxID=74557 RepID=A0A1W0A277_9STRA|nr:trimethylguanosine synthase [Thraustotheca clavata]
MAITYRSVYLVTDDDCMKKRGKKKKSKKQRVLSVHEEDLVHENEQKEMQELLHGEMEMAGVGGLLPLAFGSTKRKKKMRIHVKFDEDGNQSQIEMQNVGSKRQREEDEDQDLIVKEEAKCDDTHIAAVEKPVNLDKSLEKYWAQRYALFTKFDHGIRLDHEGWFSVTPEVISKHHAKRIACDLVIDAFTGCGGNAIQLALTCRQVIAIDMDPCKIEIAKHNAKVYGVADRIEWLVGDAFQLLPNLQADVIFLSPPWGGPEYLNAPEFTLDTMMMGDQSGIDLFHLARKITSNIVYFLPRNTSKAQIRSLVPEETCEFEHNFLNKKLKTITIYCGALACALDRSSPSPESSG